MKPVRTPAEREILIREIQDADTSLSREQSSLERTVELAEKSVRLVYGLCAVVVAVTLWAARQQWTVGLLQSEVEKHTQQLEAARAQHESDSRAAQTQQNTIVANRTERQGEIKEIRGQITDLYSKFSTIAPDLKELTKMIIQRDYGETNREYFERRKTNPAPDPTRP